MTVTPKERRMNYHMCRAKEHLKDERLSADDRIVLALHDIEEGLKEEKK